METFAEPGCDCPAHDPGYISPWPDEARAGTLTDFPQPFDGIPAYVSVGKDERITRRADAPAYAVAVQDLVCSALDLTLSGLSRLMSDFASEHPDMETAERDDPGITGCLVRYAIQGWATRTAPEPE